MKLCDLLRNIARCNTLHSEVMVRVLTRNATGCGTSYQLVPITFFRDDYLTQDGTVHLSIEKADLDEAVEIPI